MATRKVKLKEKVEEKVVEADASADAVALFMYFYLMFCCLHQLIAIVPLGFVVFLTQVCLTPSDVTFTPLPPLPLPLLLGSLI